MNTQVLCAISVSAAVALGAEALEGQWIAEKNSRSSEKTVQLTLHRSQGRGSWMSSNQVAITELRGLAPEFLQSRNGMTQFEVVRPAGRFQCEGYFKNGKGAGAFDFQPDAGFRQEMRSLGYIDIGEDKVFTLAVHNFSPQFVRDLKTAGVENPSLDQLIAMNIHGVTSQYISELRGLGYTIASPDKIVAMRIHGVTPQGIREIRSLGYEGLDADKLISMKIHGASPDFIRELATEGFKKVPVDQLITMRIHGVTPDYIRKVHARGINVSIEKMVQMRIHGID